jgi:hypothetical protein
VGVVYLKTSFGASRILDQLVGEQLPRICWYARIRDYGKYYNNCPRTG